MPFLLTMRLLAFFLAPSVEGAGAERLRERFPSQLNSYAAATHKACTAIRLSLLLGSLCGGSWRGATEGECRLRGDRMKGLSLHREQVAVPLPPQREARLCDAFIANNKCVVKIRVAVKSLLPLAPFAEASIPRSCIRCSFRENGKDDCRCNSPPSPWLPLRRELARSD